MNEYDRLLDWVSERGEGSWQQWRGACDDLGLEPTRAARSLSALGHVELDWVHNSFAVAPPTAVLTFRSSGCVIVTGARPRDLRERLEHLYEERYFDVDLRDPVTQQRGPETWLVEAEMNDVQAFCEAAELGFELDSGRRVARALPVATLEAVGEEVRPSDRFDRAWFDPGLCHTHPNKNPHTEGLWLVKEERREIAFIRRDQDWWRVPTREYGPYVAYPEASFITYRVGAESLTVDAATPLPPLLARAITLQSGRLPLFESRSKRTYVNIDQELATLVEKKLNTLVKWER